MKAHFLRFFSLKKKKEIPQEKLSSRRTIFGGSATKEIKQFRKAERI